MTKNHSPHWRKVALGVLLIAPSSMLLAQVDTTKRIGRDSSRTLESEEIKSNIPVITLDDNDADNASSDDGQSISSVLYGGRDPYFSSIFNFGAARFRIRGYDSKYTETMINGVSVRNLTSGMTTWNLWGGLNDVMRSRNSSFGLRPVDFSFGDIGGANFVDTRATRQSKGFNLNYALTNRNYNHRVMGSWSSGMLRNGWAFTVAGSYRYADKGYVKGTFYNGASYFVAIDKKINDKHLLSFTTFGTPTKNGLQTASTQEAMDLAGDKYYNPSWGYQNGKIRSANYNRTYQPYFILTHDWKTSAKSHLLTSAAYQFGNTIRTALDWYNAPDPRPDYYRNLPSYWSDNPDVAAIVADNFRNGGSQINWANLYNANRNNIVTVGDVTGRRSHYILSDRVTGTKHLIFNSVYNAQVSSIASLTAGISYNQQDDHNYTQVNDLLGGDFFVNVNQFAERAYPGNTANQFDVDNPNRLAREGDKYGYDYNYAERESKAFLQSTFTFKHIDFFLSGAYSSTQLWRDGNVRNGLFPDNSLGKSTVFTFINYAAKGGITYKINGRNYLYGNVYYGTKAPYAGDVFISPRNRNTAQTSVTSEKVFNAEGGYILNWEKVRFRLNGYYATFRNGMDVMSYYDDSYGNFVNYALNGIGRKYYGLETGVEVPIYGGLTAKAAANIGRYTYDTRQNAVITVDNSAAVVGNQIVYSKNFKLSQTPQEAYTVGLNYQGKDRWFANINANYFAQMWESMNPVRRTVSATSGIVPGSAQWYDVIDQRKLPSTYTVDFYGGKTVYANIFSKRRLPIAFTVGVSNLTNNKKLVTSAFEQLRYDYTSKTASSFPSKYYYAYGANYFLSVGIKF